MAQQSSVKQVGDYHISSVVSNDIFSTIYRAFHSQSNEQVILKYPKITDQKTLAYLKHEMSVSDGLQHPNLVKLRPVQCQNTNRLYLLLKDCAGGNLEDYIDSIGALSEDTARRMMIQIRNGMCCLKDRRIIHRALSAKNVYLSDNSSSAKPCIVNLNLSRTQNDDEDNIAGTICGSPLYTAPEILMGEAYNSKVDLWSFGVLLFFVLTGYVPYRSVTPFQLVNEQSNPLRYPKELSERSISFLRRLLCYDPKQRIDWDAFRNHEWFSNPLEKITNLRDPMALYPKDESDDTDVSDQYKAYIASLSSEPLMEYSGGHNDSDDVELEEFLDSDRECGVNAASSEHASQMIINRVNEPNNMSLKPDVRSVHEDCRKLWDMRGYKRTFKREVNEVNVSVDIGKLMSVVKVAVGDWASGVSAMLGGVMGELSTCVATAGFSDNLEYDATEKIIAHGDTLIRIKMEKGTIAKKKWFLGSGAENLTVYIKVHIFFEKARNMAARKELNEDQNRARRMMMDWDDGSDSNDDL